MTKRHLPGKTSKAKRGLPQHLPGMVRRTTRDALAAFLALTLAFGNVLPALAAEKKEEAQPAETKTYPPLLIGPGDILAIAVYGEQELPVEYQVDSQGIITYPYAGNVKLGGLTPSEASAKMAGLLGKTRKVTVLIRESNTYWVSILGNVPKPGKYQIRGQPTLLSALAEAGGPLPNSDLGGSILIHQNYKSRIDLGKLLKGQGDIEEHPYMYPGDTLVVQKSGWPSIGEIAIVASILASLAVVTVQLDNLSNR